MLLNSCSANSQTKQSLSAGLYAGGFFHGGQFGAKNGFNLGADLEARTNKFGVYLNFTYNYSKKSEDLNNANSEKGNVTLIEIYGGPRWYIGDIKKINGTIDAGLGFYRLPFEGNMGINFGLGFNYPLNNSLDISLKGKYHLFARDYVTAYGGLYLGLRYYFVK